MTPRRETEAPAECEQSVVIHIDTQAIPAQARDALAAATMDLLNGILSQPGGRERLEAKKAELAAQRRMQKGVM